MLPGPPAIFQTILNHPNLDEFDFSTPAACRSPARRRSPTQMIIDMREKLGFENVVTGYGLTESHGITTMCRHDDDPETIAKTAGRAIPDVEVRVVDERANVVPTGRAGRGRRAGLQPHEGLLRQPRGHRGGDRRRRLAAHRRHRVSRTPAGNLTITDRIKDMFIVGGFNAYPAEIENIMTGHDGVASVAVVGVPDQRLGEVGMAFVVPATGDRRRRRRADRVVPREHGQLQGAALRRVRREPAAQRVEQGA